MTTGPDDRTMVIERVIAAPRAAVWAAWSDPAALPRWWGPDGFSCRTRRIDLRAGSREGRIYRVYPVDSTPRPIPRLDRLDTAGLVAAAFEDFGLTPLEAAAFGRPTAALRAGGYLDTVVDGETGVHFATPEPAVIAAAVRRMLDSTWDADRLVAQAARFSLDRFTTRLTEVVRDVGGWRSDGTTRGHDRDR